MNVLLFVSTLTSQKIKYSKLETWLFAASGNISRIVDSVFFFYFDGNSRKDPIRSLMTSHKLESVEPHFQPDEKLMSQNLRELAA